MKPPYYQQLKFKIFCLIIIVVLIIAAVIIASSFKFRRFTLFGTENITTDQVSKYINPYLGENIFLIPVDVIQNNIKKDILYAQNVYVVKQLPSTISIKIQEYKPAAIIDYQDKNYVVNKNGLVLSQFKNSSALNIPLIQSTDKPGDVPLNQIQIIYTYLNSQGENWSPTLLKYIGQNQLQIIYPNWTITILTDSDINQKFNIMKYIYGNLSTTKCTQLDIRFDRPVCTNN